MQHAKDLRPHHLSQGEYAIGQPDGRPLTTILGSCVASCLYDPLTGIGGMNHFLLPESTGQSAQAASFGVNAMELLINDLIKHGAQRGRFKAKVFGGARMIAGLSDIGAKNARFILDFLQREGIECTGQSLGGTQARRVEFWPDSGRARQRLLAEAKIVETVPLAVPAHDVELF
ncbi:chemotaxis protein CheD [Paenirhodobacter sp. CAU 1674]|uniref:chemotaxis protein CheD n=1 Tax=Paenirhodobacter sp. CAU 1674 TaxID=3032596 RepID=UPI0023DC4DC4|nr:chemotaxis protein CheD [Paenirhodobacter sp. CAU 1674]MDF2142336.1 chemotaxis protein CheD [Paenirhodobacter sp. CAU 1674]